MSGGGEQTIGQRILQLRTERGWTQDELEARSGLSRVSISKLETGRTRARAATLRRLAQAFAISVEDLTGHPDPYTSIQAQLADRSVLTYKSPAEYRKIADRLRAHVRHLEAGDYDRRTHLSVMADVDSFLAASDYALDNPEVQQLIAVYTRLLKRACAAVDELRQQLDAAALDERRARLIEREAG